MSASEVNVTVDDVRMELGDTDGSIPVEIIEYHLGRAKAHVLENAPSDASVAALETAIAIEAAVRVAAANKELFEAGFSIADVSKDFDTSSYLANLRDRRDDALDDLGTADTPTVRSLGGRGSPRRR